MRWLIVFLACGMVLGTSAHAQQARVVTTCGSTAPFGPLTAGSVVTLSVDTNGNLCSGASGGGGGAATIADGADQTQGSKTDTPCAVPTSAAPCSTIALEKTIATAASGPLQLKVKRLSALTNTAVQIGTSAAGGDMLVGLQCGNVNAAAVYIQVIDKATIPTIGSDAPGLGSYMISPSSGTGGFALGIAAIASTTGIWAAATTGAANGTAPTTAVDCNAFYWGT